MTSDTKESTRSGSAFSVPITTRKGWTLSIAFVILFLLGFVPWPWYYSSSPYLGGWLPLPLAYWWLLEVTYTVFIFYMTYYWLNSTRARRMQQAQREDDTFPDTSSGGEY